MGSVDVRHSGAASGINNAVRRTAASCRRRSRRRSARALRRRGSNAGSSSSDSPTTSATRRSQRSKLNAAELPADLDAAPAARFATLNMAFVTDSDLDARMRGLAPSPLVHRSFSSRERPVKHLATLIRQDGVELKRSAYP